MTWFRMSDRPGDDKPAIAITRDEAARWNTPEQGFGIFATVNSFDGPRRKEFLTRINAWAVDMDDGTKEQQSKRLLGAPLIPSLIVETKRGYQAYWIAKDGKAEHWNAIVLERLVPYFGADKNARDICRILRVPGFLHLKDPSDPFLIRVAWRHAVSYSERQIANAFTWVPDPRTVKHAEDEERRTVEREDRERARKHAAETGTAYTETFWEAVFNLDCEEGLRRLSGHWAVGGEKYDFRRTGRGNLNIFVNGAGSPCFIDGAKRIGSPSDGGPTLAQWLRWFKHDWKTVVAVLKEIFPQLDEIDRSSKEQRSRRVA
jgi:hypothetical protein